MTLVVYKPWKELPTHGNYPKYNTIGLLPINSQALLNTISSLKISKLILHIEWEGLEMFTIFVYFSDAKLSSDSDTKKLI